MGSTDLPVRRLNVRRIHTARTTPWPGSVGIGQAPGKLTGLGWTPAAGHQMLLLPGLEKLQQIETSERQLLFRSGFGSISLYRSTMIHIPSQVR